VRGSQDQGKGKACLHLVSAWATANGLALAQRKLQTGENEIVAIPGLLAQLYLRGCIVTFRFAAGPHLRRPCFESDLFARPQPKILGIDIMVILLNQPAALFALVY
jgi:hypothetical protein